MTPAPFVFLVDVDNTLLDNDRIQADLKRHLEREFGAVSRDRYWAILEALFVELGYRDYLGALQRYRVEHPRTCASCRCRRTWSITRSPIVSTPGRSTCWNGSARGARRSSSPMVTSCSSRARWSAPASGRPWTATC